MPALPRGRCAVCRQDVALRRNGALREHRPGLLVCSGSGVGPYSADPSPIAHEGHTLQGVWDVPYGATAEIQGDRIVVYYSSSKSFDAEGDTTIECADCLVPIDTDGYVVEDA